MSPARATGVVLQPGSQANPGKRFAVVDYWQLTEWRSGDLDKLPVISTHASKAAAEKARDAYTVAGTAAAPAAGGDRRCERCERPASTIVTLRTAQQGKTIRRMTLCTPHAELEDRKAKRNRTQRLDSAPLPAGA